jgi:DegV family protein with EDD domain
MLPGVSVAVVDSLSAGMGQGFVALAAARAVTEGASFTEAVARAEDVSRRVRLFVTLDTLDYLAKASRIPQVAAFLGGVLTIKPIIQISGGDIRPVARVRSRRRSIEALFEQVRASIPPNARVHLAVQHARAYAEALALEARLRDTFDCREVYTTEFTPIMGGYCGPGLLGVAFYCEADGDEC